MEILRWVNRALKNAKDIVMSAISALLGSSIRHEGGATALEYAFIASLISIAIYTAANTIGTDLSGVFTTVASSF